LTGCGLSAARGSFFGFREIPRKLQIIPIQYFQGVICLFYLPLVNTGIQPEHIQKTANILGRAVSKVFLRYGKRELASPVLKPGCDCRGNALPQDFGPVIFPKYKIILESGI
jgi:hypothetical protein